MLTMRGSYVNNERQQRIAYKAFPCLLTWQIDAEVTHSDRRAYSASNKAARLKLQMVVCSCGATGVGRPVP